MQDCAAYSTLETVNYNNDQGINKVSLAKSLACLVDESPLTEKICKTRMELKRLIEIRIKKRVKEQYVDGKFHDLMAKVVANPMTLRDAYLSIKLNSNISLAYEDDDIFSESIAEELLNGNFDVNANTFSISTKGKKNETLVLPNIKLRVVQEAIRIVLEIVFRPQFSKISHGCRSGRGHHSAGRYICKEIHNVDWWFTLHVNKKLDQSILDKLFSTMEEKIEDSNLFCVIREMFDAQVLNLEFGGYPKGHGLPQEGILSPILINIFLDLFDHEFYKICMRYEALGFDVSVDRGGSHSKLRSWFRRHMKDGDHRHPNVENTGLRLHACRYMDEIFLAVSGTKDVALRFKADVMNYLQNSLHLDLQDQTEVLPVVGPQGIQFLGTLIRTGVRESPAIRTVHKLKEKVQLFASQKQKAWDLGTIRIGKKWLAHGLKKVKESEIKHLADCNSGLSKISHFRKAGMETDHWFKVLLKVWVQDINAKAENHEEIVLSKYISEPALPQELRDSFHIFQERAKEYVSCETALTLALLPNSSTTTQSITITEIVAPINVIKKRLLRYGLINSEGHPRPVSSLILQDNTQIVDWFSGLSNRWLRWYSECINFNEVKLIIVNQIRKSCIRTLAAKHRMHETEIEKRFEMELTGIPSTQEMDLEVVDEMSDSQFSYDNQALIYGISYSGLCLLSLARIVSTSRPCNCFVMGCSAAAPGVYTLHVMERQRFPGWKTGFPAAIHPSLNRRRIGLCKQHVRDLYLGHISLQSINFGAWR
ncbi:PREDICTED: uncharacterized protein LOC104592266 isoform X2 [Nelumbo nucifera]|nr:PREDICTED: uncharacterized protein LOC104592266 isoform X2 [Nelumbo nucifera]